MLALSGMKRAMNSDSEKPNPTGFDTRALVVTVLLMLAMSTTALLADDPVRDDILLALGYVLSFRLVMLVYSGRSRNLLVVLAVPVIGGVLISAWWAVLLCLVNGALGLVFGSRRDIPREPLSRRELSVFVALEAALLAAGVGAGQLARA